MSDTFWVQLFGFLGVLATMYWQHRVSQSKAQTIETKLDHNNNVTEAGAILASSANRAATEAVVVNKDASDKIIEKVNETNKALNGRTSELVEAERKAARAEGVLEGSKIHDGIVNRIATLEGGHEMLVQGQIETGRKIDKLTDAVNGVGVEVRKQSKF